ncbi:odorant receptor 285 [Tribolium castaneum]|uniref:Odorant receptor n=1 Tax=Tribolium castaneum TaxID=7070 RepID=D6WEV5_TRICA|nr:odorant receptor 285 [Tribolium castaneum]
MISFNEKLLLDSNQKDELWFLRKVYIDIYTTKIAKILLRLLFINCIFLMSVQAVLFLQKFEASYLLKYVAGYSGSFFVLACFYAVPIMVKTMKVKFIAGIKKWRVDSASEKIKNEIKTTAFIINIYTGVTVVLGVFCSLLFSIPTEDDTDFIFSIALMDRFVPEWKSVLMWPYRFSLFPLAVILTTPCFVVIYVVHHARFQMLLLLHYLKNVNSGHMTQSIGNARFQKEIRKRLKFCIKRHNHIITSLNQCRIDLYNLIIVFAVTGGLMLISILIFLFSFQGSFKSQYVRVTAFTIEYILTFSHVIVVGQMSENVTFEFFQILKTVDWNRWNLSNQKTYLVFLENTQNHFKIQFSENIALNYELGVSILKTVASMLSVLNQIKSIDYSKEKM